jgi:tetratricopeptide (TPR) repeat protein
MKNLLLTCFIFSIQHLFAQKEIINNTIDLIQQKKWTSANTYLDSILLLSPKNIDAHMMKGNIILNKHLLEKEPISFISTLDENILDNEAPGVNMPTPVVDKKQADSVEVIWRNALMLDMKREDIHMGLCALFGMSLQLEKLQKQLLALKVYSTKGNQTALLMVDYARLFRERGKLKESNSVFETIVSLYPNLSAVRSDWAGELLFMGDLVAAKQIAMDASKLTDIDGITREGLSDVFTYANSPFLALIVQKKYAQTDSSYHLHKLYEALLKFGGDDEIWLDYMRMQLNQPEFKEDTSDIAQLCRFITSPNFKNDYNSYMAMLAVPTSNFPTWVVLKKANNTFPDSVFFKLLIAEYFLSGKNYPLAVDYFKKAFSLPMDSAMKDDAQFIYAYSLYKFNNTKESSTFFESYMKHPNLFKRQAATYFYAKINKRKDLMELLSLDREKTKFVDLARVSVSTWVK